MSGDAAGRGILRVQVLSDLHVEHGRRGGVTREAVETGADIVLLPGDIDTAERSVQTAVDLFPAAEVIAMVGGNHEHYGTRRSIDEGIASMKEAAECLGGPGRRILVLEDDVAVVEVRGVSVRLAGATLWTDFALFGDPALGALAVESALNDYRLIAGRPGLMDGYLGGRRILRTSETLARHAASRAFLEGVLATPHDGPTFVLTHHCISMRSVHQRWRNDRVSAGFASAMDDVLAMGPTLWVHGHTHDGFLYRDEAGGSLVVCNPSGYLMGGAYENARFDPRLVIDVRRGGPDRAWTAGVARLETA